MKRFSISNIIMSKKPQPTAQAMFSHHIVLDMKDYTLSTVIYKSLEEIQKINCSISKILPMSILIFT